MKRKTGFFGIIGIIALVAIIGFGMLACDDKPQTVSVNFMFRNQQPPASLNVSIARSVMGGTTTDTASYTNINAFYASKPNLIHSVTPAVFNVYSDIFFAIVNGERYKITWHNIETVDFVQGTEVLLPDGLIVGDNVSALMVPFKYFAIIDQSNISGPPLHPHPTTTFTVSTALHENHPWRSDTASWGTTFSDDYKTITVPTGFLFPGTAVPSRDFGFIGTEYKYQEYFETGVFNNNVNMDGGFITPWAGHTVTGTFTFSVNWQLDNAIEQRCTSSGAEHSCADCVYVLRNKFWEGFSFTVN